MELKDQCIVVTGAGAGIGAALCRAFVRAGAATVVASDIDTAAIEALADEIGCIPIPCDVSVEADVVKLIDEVEERFGGISIFCSNAGIANNFDLAPENVAFASNESWQKGWDINVMAHVYAARTLIPRMRARGGGYFVNTISAAGLLSQVGSAVYATTKHAAVGFAESVAIAHRADNIRVSILCPQAVDTKMMRSAPKGPQSTDGVMSPEEVATVTVRGIENEDFLILPHPEVARYMQNKVNDYDRWLRGMAKIQDSFRDAAKAATASPE
jgi:NAD(P)-dependent dehydrogenase (short-subunit alcohol dehydrogenase family)